MEFKIHESVIHCYNPTDKAVVLINKVSGNKKGFSKIQINSAEQVKKLYPKLGYSSVKDFRRIVQIQQNVDCPVAVQDIDIVHKIWGKKIAALKGNTTEKKLTHTAGGIVIVPKELIKLHKYVFMTAYLLLLNGMPFFISLSYNINVSIVINLEYRKSITTFKAFKQICMYYLKRGFRITTLHVDGKFAKLQSLLQVITGRPRFNL